MPQASLGFALQSLPLSESRAAFRRPCASLRVRDRSLTGAKAPEISDRFRQRTPSQPPRAIPCGSRGDHRRGRLWLPTAVMSGHRVETRELPRTPLFGDHRNLRAPPARGRLARYEALLPPRVRSPTDRASRRGSRARACAPTRRDRPGRCSPGLQPLQSCSPPRPRVRYSASRARGEPDAPRKTTPHSGCGERRFDPEV